MSNYEVGSNKPIKIKVSISTAGHASTAFFLNDPDNEGAFLRAESNASFSNSNTARWRNINAGKTVKGRTIFVRTILDFPQEFPDENTFNQAVAQAKRTYKVELSGGTPPQDSFDFNATSAPGGITVFKSTISLT